MLEAARENGLEGIIAKHANSCYESRRSREWLKIKIVSEQEFVIGGFTEPQGDRDYFGALVLGVYEDGKLRWVGNVGTGFDQKTLAALHARHGAADYGQVPVRRAAQAGPRHDVGQARTGVPGEVRQLDAGQPPARAGLPGPAPRRGRTGRWRANPPCPHPSWLAGSAKEATLEIDGRTLKFTNLKKVYYPDEGYTKRRRAQLLRRGGGA